MTIDVPVIRITTTSGKTYIWTESLSYYQEGVTTFDINRGRVIQDYGVFVERFTNTFINGFVKISSYPNCSYINTNCIEQVDIDYYQMVDPDARDDNGVIVWSRACKLHVKKVEKSACN